MCALQACARQVLGKEDVAYPAYYYEDECKHCCHEHGACTGYGVVDHNGTPLAAHTRWNHDRGYNQWFIDAFKIDPVKMMEEEYGIWERGVPQPVQEVSVAGASPGSVPTLTAFIATHARHGTRIFFPKNATGGGRVDSWDEYEWWTTHLTEEEKERLKQRNYYNMEEALQRSCLPGLQQLMQEAQFSEDFFLVCLNCITTPVAGLAAPCHTRTAAMSHPLYFCP